MIDLEDWRSTYGALQSVGVHSTRVTEGVCKKVLGARALFAVAQIEIAPSDILRFASTLDGTTYARAMDEGWIRAIYLGVLDVMLIKPVVPITVFQCTLKRLQFHEIDSSSQAFRLAGRYAAEAFLAQEKFVTL